MNVLRLLEGIIPGKRDIGWALVCRQARSLIGVATVSSMSAAIVMTLRSVDHQSTATRPSPRSSAHPTTAATLWPLRSSLSACSEMACEFSDSLFTPSYHCPHDEHDLVVRKHSTMTPNYLPAELKR